MSVLISEEQKHTYALMMKSPDIIFDHKAQSEKIRKQNLELSDCFRLSQKYLKLKYLLSLYIWLCILIYALRYDIKYNS